MARENKFASSGGAKETPVGKLMETIVEDVITAKAMTFAQWHALSANPLVPLAIPVSQGGQYPVTQVGVDVAHMLSQQSWKSREALRQTIDREAFMKLSFQAIGDTLRDCQSRLPTVPDGQNEHDVLLGDDFYAVLNSTLKSTGSWSGELWSRRKGGEPFAELRTVSVVHDKAGAVPPQKSVTCRGVFGPRWL